jgi:DNA-binding HxlR family transcriptional regulator
LEEEGIERDRQRAEVFDALGHPTRILILKTLNEGALGFADLKKKTGIESSGHLQHHLSKLNGLIKTDEYGKYCLTEQGKDAFLTVQTVEHMSSTSAVREKAQRHYLNRKPSLKSIGLMLAVSLLIASCAVAVFEYNQIMKLNNENSFFRSFNPEAVAFINEFGNVIPIVNVNSSVAPPISVYQALQIAFESQGLNKEALKGMVVYADLMIGQTVSNITNIVQQVTEPAGNYSDFKINGTNYEYLWEIQTHYHNQGSIPSIPPLGFTLTFIDASTGQTLQTPPVG